MKALQVFGLLSGMFIGMNAAAQVEPLNFDNHFEFNMNLNSRQEVIRNFRQLNAEVSRARIAIHRAEYGAQNVTRYALAFEQHIEHVIYTVRTSEDKPTLLRVQQGAQAARRDLRAALTRSGLMRDPVVNQHFDRYHATANVAFSVLGRYRQSLIRDDNGVGNFVCSASDNGWEEHRGGHTGYGRNIRQAQRQALQSCQRIHGDCTVDFCHQQP
jgi:hypothetical protein